MAARTEVARSFVRRAGWAGVCLWAALGPPVSLAGDGGVQSLAEREIARRDSAIQQATTLMQEGHAARKDRDLALAIDSYQQALHILPVAPATAALRSRLVKAYAEAATARAEELAALARYEDANRTLDEVLLPDRAPDYRPALRLKEQIQDPEYFNPALTPAHLENVQKVTEHLTLADGHFTLGDFDKASEQFNRALAIDPTNTAARRGLERVERRIIEHHRSSRSHTRAAALREVDSHWATTVPELATDLGGVSGDDRGGSPSGRASTFEKLKTIMLPQVQLVDNSLEEVIEYLVIQSKSFDDAEPDPSRKGVNIVLRGDATLAAKRVTLSLSDVSLLYVLETVVNLAGTHVRVDEFMVIVGPASETDLVTEKFRVPPGFFSTSPVAAVAGRDPFAVDSNSGQPGSGGLSFARIRPEDYFRQNGVPFPTGASAFFSPVTGELTVRNTPLNLNLIRQIVEDSSSVVPKMVKVRATMLEVNQENIEELGFDWLLAPFNVGSGGVFAAGGTPGNQPGGDLDTMAQNYPFVPPGGQPPVGGNPITAGNRSGNSALEPNSIDSLLNGRVNTNSGLRAPAQFGVSGVFTDPQFQVVMRGLNQKKGIDLSSSPEVVIKSGQRAKVEVIREFPYPTEFEPPEIPQSVAGQNAIGLVDLGGGQIGIIALNTGFQGGAFPVTPTTPTAFEIAKLGHILEVEATVGPDNRTIDLNVSPAYKEFEGFINYGTPITTVEAGQRVVLTENRIPQPVFRQNKADGVSVTLWSGNTMVIAGLAGEERISVRDKTPIFGDLPYVGRFFRSKVDAVRQKSVIFMITAEVVDPSGEAPPAVISAVGN